MGWRLQHVPAQACDRAQFQARGGLRTALRPSEGSEGPAWVSPRAPRSQGVVSGVTKSEIVCGGMFNT